MYNSPFLPPSEPGITTTIFDDATIMIPNPYHPSPNCLMENYHFNYHHQGSEVSHHHHHHHHFDLQVLDQQPPSFINNNNFEASTSSFTALMSQPPFTQEITSTGSSASSVDGMSSMDGHMQEEWNRDMKSAKVEGHVIAIRTKTELETLDDGFQWRKYGKKMVKSNPNPRHYYKCKIGGCKVKKRVERDREDSSYLLTTYDGKHNHESPCPVVYCDRLPFLMLRPSQSSSS